MVDCTGFIEPLNLQCLLVNTLSGSMNIFILIAFIFISSMAAFFRMSNIIAMSMFALFGVIMSIYIGFQLYVLIIFIAGLSIFWSLKKIIGD